MHVNLSLSPKMKNTAGGWMVGPNIEKVTEEW